MPDRPSAPFPGIEETDSSTVIRRRRNGCESSTLLQKFVAHFGTFGIEGTLGDLSIATFQTSCLLASVAGALRFPKSHESSIENRGCLTYRALL
jgi:hypothetical protein